MKKYEKPVVAVNEGLAEGVYAASGSACWTVTVGRTSNVTSEYREFQIDAYHTNPELHNAVITVYVTFTQDVAVVSDSSANASGASGTTAWFTWDIGPDNPTEGKGYAVTVSCVDPANIDVVDWNWSCGGVA